MTALSCHAFPTKCLEPLLNTGAVPILTISLQHACSIHHCVRERAFWRIGQSIRCKARRYLCSPICVLSACSLLAQTRRPLQHRRPSPVGATSLQESSSAATNEIHHRESNASTLTGALVIAVSPTTTGFSGPVSTDFRSAVLMRNLSSADQPVYALRRQDVLRGMYSQVLLELFLSSSPT